MSLQTQRELWHQTPFGGCEARLCGQPLLRHCGPKPRFQSAKVRKASLGRC
jgi:hypothetical protein